MHKKAINSIDMLSFMQLIKMEFIFTCSQMHTIHN